MTGASDSRSPVIDALADARKMTSVRFRVHFSKRWIEPSPLRRARNLLRAFEPSAEGRRLALLLYVNPRRKKFSWVWGHELDSVFTHEVERDILNEAIEDFQSTHPENAAALFVRTLAALLAERYPS